MQKNLTKPYKMYDFMLFFYGVSKKIRKIFGLLIENSK